MALKDKGNTVLIDLVQKMQADKKPLWKKVAPKKELLAYLIHKNAKNLGITFWLNTY